MYNYRHLVVVTSKKPLQQESQLQEVVKLVEKRLEKEYGCSTIRKALTKMDI